MDPDGRRPGGPFDWSRPGACPILAAEADHVDRAICRGRWDRCVRATTRRTARPAARHPGADRKPRCGGGTIGAAAAAKAPPDGYTFFVGAAHHAIAPAVYPKLSYSIETDFIPIAMIARPPHVVVVHPGKVTATTLAELIAHARANPDKINYGSAGGGTTHHLAGELFKLLTNTRINHIPYRGAGPLMQDLLAGHVDMAFDGLGTSASQIGEGRIRALAVAASSRVPAFPNLPTAAEAGVPGYEVATLYALWAPKNTPAAIVTRM